jgi:hypothetical protein
LDPVVGTPEWQRRALDNAAQSCLLGFGTLDVLCLKVNFSYGLYNSRPVQVRHVKGLLQSMLCNGILSDAEHICIAVPKSFIDSTSLTPDITAKLSSPKIVFTRAALLAGSVQALTGQHRMAALKEWHQQKQNAIKRLESLSRAKNVLRDSAQIAAHQSQIQHGSHWPIAVYDLGERFNGLLSVSGLVHTSVFRRTLCITQRSRSG